MDSPEFEEIMAALQTVVRRAYSLGRTEALKRVVEVMEKDETTWKPLALRGPTPQEPASQTAAPAEETAADYEPAGAPQQENVPWYLRNRPAAPVRRTH